MNTIHKLQKAIEDTVSSNPVIGGILVGVAIIAVATLIYRSIEV